MIGVRFQPVFAFFAAVLTTVAWPAVAAPMRSVAAIRFDAMVADAKAKMLVDPAQTVVLGRAVEAAAGQLEKDDRITGVATAQWLQGEAYLRLNDLVHAAPLIDHAIASIKDQRPTKLMGDLLISRGGIDTAKPDVAAALADYQQAHNIFRDIGDTRSRAVALMFIALLYQEAKDYDNALKYYRQSIGVYRADPQILYAIYNNRGNALKEIHRVDEAEDEYHKALDIAHAQNSAGMEARVLSNIARAQLLKGELYNADRTIAQGLTLSRGADAAVAREQFWVLAAKSALQHGHAAQASELIARRFTGVDLKTTTLDAREGHEAAYAIYKKTGDEPLALQHLEALKRLDDQTSTLAASANTALAAARFDFANQELKITTLQRDDAKQTIEFERARARTQQFIFVGASVVTIVIVGMLGFGIITIRRSRDEVRAANIGLAETNSALGKALAAKTEFLATTSHEIRTPLNGILGMTQVMLADATLGAATRDRIGVVHGAGVTMRALVDDILDVAKMETGNLTVEAVPFDLRATLRDVSRMWEEQARGKGLAFTLDLDDCPDHIVGDAARLRQIAFNLLSNALKFTENGSVSLRAGTAESAEGPMLTLAVSDTGIGIPADKHELIFESFRQADGGTTRKFGGTGLGLSICRNLARAMRGDMTVESADGEGATFTLTLPLVRASAPENVHIAVAGEETSALLILDRSPITRAMLRTMLEPRAGSVVLSASAEEATEKLATGDIAMLLIDDATVKPLDDPMSAIGALVASAHDGGARVALLWAGLEETQREAFVAMGIDLVIAKPIAGPALAATLYPPNGDATASNTLVTRAA